MEDFKCTRRAEARLYGTLYVHCTEGRTDILKYVPREEGGCGNHAEKVWKKTNHFSNAEGWIETAKNILDPDMVTYDILHGNFHVYIQSGNGTNIIVCMTVKNTGKHEYVNAIDTAFELTDNGINRGREIILYEKEKALPQIKTEGERLPPFSRSDSAEKN